MTLSYSRVLYLELFFDQTTENFLRGHVHYHFTAQPCQVRAGNQKGRVERAIRP